jgi:DNA-binding transcriptional LysR family regulator
MFTQAARVSNLAQSAASNAIAVLESQHDAKLFDRVERHIELTEAGKAFLLEARSVLARADAAELPLMEFGGLKRGTLSVEASPRLRATGCHVIS